MEGWSLFNQYGTYDVPFSQSQSNMDGENQNAISTPSSTVAVGGPSDTDDSDLIGMIQDTVDAGLDIIAPAFGPGGRAAIGVGRALGKALSGNKRKRYNGPTIPETPPHRMGQDGGDGGDGTPPPSGPGGNIAGKGGAGNASTLCCCPCDPKMIKYSDVLGFNELDPVASGGAIGQNKCAYNSYLLNGIPNGTDFGARIGRKINLRWLRLRCTVMDQSPSITTISEHLGCTFRITLVYDKQVNGSMINPTGLFQNSTNMHSLLNLDNRHRFVILLDKTYTISPNLYAAHYNGNYDFAINLRSLPTVYSGTSALVTDVATGALFMVISNTRVLNGAGTNRLAFTYAWRLCYLDA